MIRIIVATLLLHVALNGLLAAAYATLLDSTTQQAVAQQLGKVKALIP